MLPSNWLNRDRIEAHSADIHQFIDFRQSTLPNGVRLIEAANSSGLSLLSIQVIIQPDGSDILSSYEEGPAFGIGPQL